MNDLLIKLDFSKFSIQGTVRHGFIFLCTVVLVFSNFYPRVEATDTILLNAKVYTVNPIQPWASACQRIHRNRSGHGLQHSSPQSEGVDERPTLLYRSPTSDRYFGTDGTPTWA